MTETAPEAETAADDRPVFFIHIPKTGGNTVVSHFLAFLPVEQVDPFTGVLVTGYGTPPGGGRGVTENQSGQAFPAANTHGHTLPESSLHLPDHLLSGKPPSAGTPLFIVVVPLFFVIWVANCVLGLVCSQLLL